MANTFNELAAGQLRFTRDDQRANLLAFVSVWLEDPRYGGAVKDELINPEVELAVKEFTMQGVKQWAENHPWLIDWLEEHCVESKREPGQRSPR